jgi:hypothetical protein
MMLFAFAVTNAQLSHTNEPDDVVLMVQRNVIGVVVPTHSAFVTVRTESVFHVALTARAALLVTDASAGSAGRGAPSALSLAKYVA